VEVEAEGKKVDRTTTKSLNHNRSHKTNRGNKRNHNQRPKATAQKWEEKNNREVEDGEVTGEAVAVVVREKSLPRQQTQT